MKAIDHYFAVVLLDKLPDKVVLTFESMDKF